MALPVLLHAPSLIGWLSENPAFLFSGISSAQPGHGLLTGYPGWIDGNAGVTTQALGGLAARDWFAGIIPWWNPYSGVGLPLAAEMQNSAFFLPFVLLLRCFDGVIYLKIALQIVAGLACRALLTELGLRPIAVLAASACFALNGSFAWFGHGPVMPIAFLPLTLFGIERARSAPFQGTTVIATGIAWSLLAGFPEVAYLDGLLALAWSLLRVAETTHHRWRLAAAIAAGGAIGLAIAAPPVAAFLTSLPTAFLSTHADASATRFLPDNRAPLLLPYIFGPPMFGGLSLSGTGSLAQFLHWFRTSGYLDLGLVTLAPMALRRAVGHTGLRLLLALWCVLALGRALGAPIITAAINLLPLVRSTVAYLYIVPSCQMAITLLAALALNDRLTAPIRPSRILAAGAIATVLALATLPAAIPVFQALAAVPSAPAYAALSLAFAAATILTVCLLASRAPRALAAFLIIEAALFFFLPLLAGTPAPHRLDTPAMAWLRAHAGLTRVNAVASLSPNYGAWFGVAAIDHNYLPVPLAWVKDVRTTLLPGMDGVNNFAAATDAAGLTALKARLPSLQSHGVGFVLLPAGLDPFVRQAAVPVAATGNRPYPLTTPLQATIAPSRLTAGTIVSAALNLGTYAGTADGTLRLTLCQATLCRQATAPLANAIDNQDLTLPLPTPLALNPTLPVTYTIAMAHPTGHPPAIWLFPAPSAAPTETLQPGLAPRLTLTFAPTQTQPIRVYADATLGIFRLPAPAPYIQARGCTLSRTTREATTALCPAPAALRRLELAAPGWHASVNGQATPITPTGIYQSVSLPQGASRIRFTYAPPHATTAWLASLLGLVMLMFCAWRGWSGRRESNPRMQLGRLPFYH